MPQPSRPPLKFRIRVSPARFLRVTVTDTKEEMWKLIEACHGEKHQHELACSIFAPGSPEKGCVAEMFFNWRALRPSVIAHEASHCSWAVATVLKENIELTDDEFQAATIEQIVDKIWIRTQTAAL